VFNKFRIKNYKRKWIFLLPFISSSNNLHYTSGEIMKKSAAKVFLLVPVSFLSFILGVVTTSDEKPITKQVIEYAQKVIGLEFTDSEQDSMMDGLNDQLKSYEAIRNFNLNNNVPPSLIFNPVPAGFKFNNEQLSLEFSSYSYAKMPSDKNDLAYYSIGELAELMRTKKISSTELTKFYLERLKKFGPQLECVITLTEELALKQAKLADEEIAQGKYRGMLHGIPYGAKDLLSTKLYKTTWGAEPFKEQIIDSDAEVIKRLEKAGAVLVAKLTMGALAWGDVWFGGKTRNPWNVNEGSSGSSAGSASAVSAGLIPFAIGTETWGSIISPSTVCGVTGLRPTYGRVSRDGAMALSWSMDKIGPICRNAEDCAIVFNSIYGADGKDQTLFDLPFNYNNKINFKGLKIGYLKNDFDKDYDFKKQDVSSLEILKKSGAELVPIEIPSEFPIGSLSIILSSEAASAFDELTRYNKDDMLKRQIKNAWPNEFRVSRFITAVEYVNANRIRYLLIQKMADLFKEVDFYIAPSWEGDNLLLTNLTGHPAVVLPNGFSDDGTPTSITFIGNLFDEGKIIAAAKFLQDASDFHKKHPDLSKLSSKRN
jgi:Asp-tRNA(Asn)/Glu-tRNA(Gln) amidotransferase A subunit family amidase